MPANFTFSWGTTTLARAVFWNDAQYFRLSDVRYATLLLLGDMYSGTGRLAHRCVLLVITRAIAPPRNGFQDVTPHELVQGAA